MMNHTKSFHEICFFVIQIDPVNISFVPANKTMMWTAFTKENSRM